MRPFISTLQSDFNVTNKQFQHETVLLQEAVDALNIQANGIYIDGTYGRGGHSALILSQLNEQGRLIAIDKDPEAIADAQAKYADDQRFIAWRGSFGDLDQALLDNQITQPIQGILLDLGVSSPQLDDASRGFSFMRDGDLDMRMNPDVGLSAQAWLAEAEEKEIADVLWRYGEEKFSRRIAKRIVTTRTDTPITRTLQLAQLIADSVPKREQGKNPATRSFQAIRIKVNQELEDVETCLEKSLDLLADQGRLVVISFHSLEDRLVKHFLREHSTLPRMPRGLPVTDDTLATPPLRTIKKAIKASQTEIEQNVRSRSAVMRIGERVR